MRCGYRVLKKYDDREYIFLYAKKYCNDGFDNILFLDEKGNIIGYYNGKTCSFHKCNNVLFNMGLLLEGGYNIFG